jgi:transcriptional regulator with XRE-family HTH domain
MQLFPQRLKYRRLRFDLSQLQLAEKAGISHRSVVAYEAGETKPTYEALQKLSRALGASIEWLMGGSDEEEAARIESAALRDSSEPIVPPILRSLVNRVIMIPAPIRPAAVEYLEDSLHQFVSRRLASTVAAPAAARPERREAPPITRPERRVSREPTDLDVEKANAVIAAVARETLGVGPSASVGGQSGKTTAPPAGIPPEKSGHKAVPVGAKAESKSSRVAA